MSFVSCDDSSDGATASKKALAEALDKLQRGDIDAYMQHLDFGCELDTAHAAVMRMAVERQLRWEIESGRTTTAFSVTQSNLHSDTLATVFYTRYLSDGDSLMCSQKMVRSQGVWRLRMRE